LDEEAAPKMAQPLLKELAHAFTFIAAQRRQMRTRNEIGGKLSLREMVRNPPQTPPIAFVGQFLLHISHQLCLLSAFVFVGRDSSLQAL